MKHQGRIKNEELRDEEESAIFLIFNSYFLIEVPGDNDVSQRGRVSLVHKGQAL